MRNAEFKSKIRSPKSKIGRGYPLIIIALISSNKSFKVGASDETTIFGKCLWCGKFEISGWCGALS